MCDENNSRPAEVDSILISSDDNHEALDKIMGLDLEILFEFILKRKISRDFKSMLAD